MTIYNIIQQLASTRSLNEKKSILTQNKDDHDLKEFFRLALNGRINFYQKKEFDVYGVAPEFSSMTLSEAMSLLVSELHLRARTGDAAVSFVHNILGCVSEDDAKVIKHILQKESGCDVGSSIVNKIWPGLIPEVPFMLATAYTTKLAESFNWKAGVNSSVKSDGGRVAIVIDYDGTVTLYSRAGNPLNVYGKFDFLGKHFPGKVLDGELLSVKPDGKFNDRKTSNGLFTKCVRDTLSQLESDSLHVTVWDIVGISYWYTEFCEVPYQERLNELKTTLKNLSDSIYISLIGYKTVYSIDEAQEHYNELRAKGEEGSMLKDLNIPWENSRSKKILKLKAEENCELIITGFKEGKGELVGNLGALEMESADGKVKVSMSGFSLKLRSQIYANLTKAVVEYTMVESGQEVTHKVYPAETDIDIGSILEVTYNEKIKQRDSDSWSLFLPRFSTVRYDKLEANTFEEIK